MAKKASTRQGERRKGGTKGSRRAPPKPHGRPLTYSSDIANEICARLAAGEGLNGICRDEHMPPAPTVRGWVIDDHEGFAARYARAREIGWEFHAEEILRMADDCRVGQIVTVKGDGKTEVKSADMVERARLQIDARKWLLSKMLPKKYGEKILHGSDPDNPLPTPVMTDYAALRKELLRDE